MRGFGHGLSVGTAALVVLVGCGPTSGTGERPSVSRELLAGTDGATPGTSATSATTGTEPAFAVTDVRVTPAQARPGDPLTCSWSFTGGSTDASTAIWLVDGVEVGRGPVLDTTGLGVGTDVVCEVHPSDGVREGAPVQAKARLPGNIVIVIADDVGVDRVHAYGVGEQQPPMPVLESLAAHGVLFDHAWAEPTCSPGRAAILTGRDPHQTGIGHAISAEARTFLRYSEVTLPEMLDAGTGGLYSSAFIGKWHLSVEGLPGNGYLEHPNDQGFDHFSGVMVGFDPQYQSDGLTSDYYSWEETTDGVNHRVQGYNTTVLTNEAIGAFDTLPEPFVLVVAYMAAHAPFQAAPPALLSGPPVGDSQDQRNVNSMIEGMDTELGRLLRTVDAGRRSRTTLFFTSDNGTPASVHSAPFAPGPGKGTVAEGGLWVPLVVAGLGVDRHGERCDHPVQVTDLYATIADLAGVTLDDGVERDSLSFAPALSDPAAPPARSVSFAEAFVNGHPDEDHDQAVLSDDLKLIVDRVGEEGLFDLGSSPVETTNLLGQALDADTQNAYSFLEGFLVP